MAASVAGVPGGGFDLLSYLSVARNIVTAGGIETSESAAALMRFKAKVVAARPEPTQTPSPTQQPESLAPAPAPVSIPEIIYAAAAEFGLSGEYLLGVAQCESDLEPTAYNPAGYHGIFQFDYQTWAAYGYGSIYDPVAQARTAARLLAAGEYERWPNCS